MIGLGEDGAYTAYGQDRDGVTERLRADDGINFTAAGYELIAEAIVRESISEPTPNIVWIYRNKPPQWSRTVGRHWSRLHSTPAPPVRIPPSISDGPQADLGNPVSPR